MITSEKVRKAYTYKKKKAEETGTHLNWGRKELEIDIQAVKKLRNEGKGWHNSEGTWLCKPCHNKEQVYGVKQYPNTNNRRKGYWKITLLSNHPIV